MSAINRWFKEGFAIFLLTCATVFTDLLIAGFTGTLFRTTYLFGYTLQWTPASAVFAMVLVAYYFGYRDILNLEGENNAK